jgi:NAD(P)-dependent dehydrogenase (short-subunit alcohol dehydrogenase family)
LAKSEEVAIVSGNGRGIGRSTAMVLALAGARVVINVKRNLSEGDISKKVVSFSPS